MHTNKILKIVMIGLMAGLCYISFMFFQIKIPTPGGFTSFHLGNTFCVLAALLLGGLEGGLAGAIGMGIADLLDPTYAIVAPKTMILKLGIDSTSGVRCTISSEAGLAIQESEPAAPLTSTLIDTGLEGIGGRTLGGVRSKNGRS